MSVFHPRFEWQMKYKPMCFCAQFETVFVFCIFFFWFICSLQYRTLCASNKSHIKSPLHFYWPFTKMYLRFTAFENRIVLFSFVRCTFLLLNLVFLLSLRSVTQRMCKWIKCAKAFSYAKFSGWCSLYRCCCCVFFSLYLSVWGMLLVLLLLQW